MTVIRRFAVASGLSRLIERQCGPKPVVEGHFSPQSHAGICVRLEPEACCLVRAEANGNAAVEERAAIPRAHAEPLVAVCAARLAFRRTCLLLEAKREALLDRFTQPNGLDLISLEFEALEERAAFVPPVWFGPELTADAQFDRASLAFRAPALTEAVVSNATLEAVLDLLEQGTGERSSSAVVQSAEPSPPRDPNSTSTPARCATPASAAEDVIANLSRALGEQSTTSAAAVAKQPAVLRARQVIARRLGG
jgi:hypothetical protein